MAPAYPTAKRAFWNMDAQTPPLMRRLSVLAGHYVIPTTFAACTDNDDEIGELNEIDMLAHAEEAGYKIPVATPVVTPSAPTGNYISILLNS